MSTTEAAAATAAAEAAAGSEPEEAAAALSEEQEGVTLSKNQRKKLAKRRRNEEQKAERVAARKKQRTDEVQTKRANIQQMLEGMTPEQVAAWRADQQAKREAREAERAAAKAKNLQALSADLKLVIDCDFDGKMNEGELRSLCQQLGYAYSSCVHGQPQAHLHLLGLKGCVLDMLQQKHGSYVNWAATTSQDSYAEYFKDRVGDVVYLTADSPNTLSELDTSKVYVIGGIVDRNRHKGICYERAQAAGVATAKLPIGDLFKLATSNVLTINQVVDILVKYAACKDWAQALQQVVPTRKVVQTSGGSSATPPPQDAEDDAAAQQEGEEGSPPEAAAGAGVEAAAEAAAAAEAGTGVEDREGTGQEGTC